jgi:hypothetical protein
MTTSDKNYVNPKIGQVVTQGASFNPTKAHYDNLVESILNTIETSELEDSEKVVAILGVCERYMNALRFKVEAASSELQIAKKNYESLFEGFSSINNQ